MYILSVFFLMLIYYTFPIIKLVESTRHYVSKFRKVPKVCVLAIVSSDWQVYFSGQIWQIWFNMCCYVWQMCICSQAYILLLRKWNTVLRFFFFFFGLEIFKVLLMDIKLLPIWYLIAIKFLNFLNSHYFNHYFYGNLRMLLLMAKCRIH